MSKKFHFKVVGDDYIGQKHSLVKPYASGRDLEVNGIAVNIKLSLYTDATEGTVTSELLEPTEPVNGYIFIYNVSDVESFNRLSMWMSQIDLYSLQPVSIVQLSTKVLFGNQLKDEPRVVEFGRALEFAQSTNMTYIEANVEDDLEVERAIVSLVKEKLPKEKLPPSALPSRKIFTRKRTVTVASPQEAIKRQLYPNFGRSSKQSAERPVEPLVTVVSEDLNTLTTVMMKLNMSVARLSFSLKRDVIDGEDFVVVDKQASGTTVKTGPLARLIQAAMEADKYVQAAQTKLSSLRVARDETLQVLKKQLEEGNEKMDDLRRENYELATEKNSLEQKLEEADKLNENSQALIDTLKQEPLARGSELNHWKVDGSEVELTDKTLGSGGYANVTVAKFRGLEIAAKRLYGIILNSYNRAMFEREMNIAARLRHPNLVQFMGAVVDKEPIILMELMPTTLREVIPKELNQLTQEQMPPICRDVARALTYLHAMKPEPIIHRDISSANILLEPAANSLWRAKVSDYGSANFLSRLNTQAPGNAVYAAPEAQFPRQQSPKMDVFSFGVLVMEMYLREFPDPNNRDQMVYEVGILYPDILSVVESCLRDDPEHRLCMYDVLQLLNHS